MYTFELNASLILINSTLQLKKPHLIWKDETTGTLLFGREDHSNKEGFIPQLLCVVADIKIEKFDYYINTQTGTLHLLITEDEYTSIRNNRENFKKVIGFSEVIDNDSVIDMKTIQSYVKKPFTKLTVKYEKYDYRPEIIGGIWDGESYQYQMRPILTPTLELIITHKKEIWNEEELPISILEDMIAYCEDKAIFDKLGNYGDFYYKAKKWLEKNTYVI